MIRVPSKSYDLILPAINAIAATIGTLTALALPAIYFLTALEYESERIEYAAGRSATEISRIAYRNPDHWSFMVDQVEGVLAKHRVGRKHAYQVRDKIGRAVVAEILPQNSLVVTRHADISNGIEVVGRLTYVEDINIIMWRSAIAALVGILLGLAMFIALKVLPMRVLQRAMTRVTVANTELEQHRDKLRDMVEAATSDLKAKTVELQLALAKEKELNTLQRQFVSMASHEFRTPLAIIDSTAQRLERRGGQMTVEDTSRRLDRIRAAVKRMVQLMESTLSAAKIESGEIKIDLVACDIGNIVSEACARQQQLAKGHDIKCDLQELPETIQGDTGLLDQVLTNLLSNAVKYSPDAPEIDVSVGADDENVTISIRDRGLGIDDADMPKMFQRFFRGKTSTGIAGTGIGLNLAKILVDMHGGTIDLESKLGEGSTFTVTLPIDGPSETHELAVEETKLSAA